MIFDIIKYGTFTTDDFINAHTNNDFSKFISLPADVKKQFISGVIDKANEEDPNNESENFKQAAFDFMDGKITEGQFRKVIWKYWGAWATRAAVVAAAVVVGVSAALTATSPIAAVAVVLASAVRSVFEDHYLPHFKKHASYLNKLIQEYQP